MADDKINSCLTPQPVSFADMMRTVGRTGLKSYAGIIHEQELPQLQNVLVRMRIFREMRLDPTIGILEQAITRVLLAADFATTPAGNTPADQYAAELLWDILNDMSVEWYEHVEDMLEHLWFGFQISQIVLKMRSDGTVGLGDLMPMAQEMTFRWGRQDETGKISGVEMLDPVTGSIYKLPSEKFLHFTDRGRKRNPEGEGMCLHVWRSWRYKTNLQELEAIGIERDVGGMPVFSLPDHPSEAEKADVAEQAKAMRQDENAGLLLPSGFTVAPYQSSSKMYDIRKTISDYAWDILAYAGAQWLKLGENNGTQALVQGTTDMFGLYLRAIQERALSVWHKQLVPTLAQFNPRLVTPNGTPKITWADPGVPDVKAILDAFASGVNSGVITPTRADEVHVRSILDLPELPDGVGMDTERNGAAGGQDILSQKIADLQSREQPSAFSEFASGFDPSEHPRAGEGKDNGGQFIPKGGNDSGGDADVKITAGKSSTDRSTAERVKARLSDAKLPVSHTSLVKGIKADSGAIAKAGGNPLDEAMMNPSTGVITLGRYGDECVVHEIGHVVWCNKIFIPGNDDKFIVANAFNASKKTGKGFPSAYSQTNPTEYFAECYNAYSIDSEGFSRKNPVMGKLLKKYWG